MTRIELPDHLDLRTASELGALALLHAALIVADEALKLEHADLHVDPYALATQRSPDVLVAYLLVQRFRELRTLIENYRAALPPPLDDLPF